MIFPQALRIGCAERPCHHSERTMMIKRGYALMLATALTLGSGAAHADGVIRIVQQNEPPGLDVTISNDLYEVLLAYQNCRRPSA